MPKVYWVMPLERSVGHLAVDAVIAVAAVGGSQGYSPMTLRNHVGMIDQKRSAFAEYFLKLTKDPKDTLVMLDNDHTHPPDILQRLVRHDMPVVSALAFHREGPPDACAYVDTGSGQCAPIRDYHRGMVRVDAVGAAAIAIQRCVFEAFMDAGLPRPWFRFTYVDGDMTVGGEDLYFCGLCKQVNIPIYVDTNLVTPHIAEALVDEVVAQELSQFSPNSPPNPPLARLEKGLHGRQRNRHR